MWETKLPDGLMGLLFLRLGGGHDLLREMGRDFLVVRELHRIAAAPARHRAQRGLVREHLRHGRLRPHGDHLTFRLHANDAPARSEEHTSELQSRENLVCRLLLEKKKKKQNK